MLSKMAAASRRPANVNTNDAPGNVTNYSNPFMTLTAVGGQQGECVSELNKRHGNTNPFLCEEEPFEMQQGGTQMPYEPKFSSTNPFVDKKYCFHDCDILNQAPCHHVYKPQIQPQPLKLQQAATSPAAALGNPFSSAHMRSFCQSTPVPCHPPCPTCPGLQALCCSLPLDLDCEYLPEQNPGPTMQLKSPPPKPVRPKSRTRYQITSDSEDDYDQRERVPTLRPGQYDGTTPWKEFLHRFESCAKANCWSEKTKAIQLKFCLVGAAGAIVHRNPRSSQWDYCRLVEELETAYGPSSEHAVAVAVELRQRVRKPGEALHVLRDDIYGKVSVAYSNRTETEQDAIGVEVFTNAVRDAEVVQKLLEKRPQTLAQAYNIAHRHETTKRAAYMYIYVTGLMHSGAHTMNEKRTRTAVIREGAAEEQIETPVALQAARWEPRPLNPSSYFQQTSPDLKN